MSVSNESLFVIVLVGIVAGWLAGLIVRGGGFGLIGDLIVGIIGAFIGDWLLPRLNIHLGVGTVSLCSCSSGCSPVAVGGAQVGAVALAMAGGGAGRPIRLRGRRGFRPLQSLVHALDPRSRSPRSRRRPS
jgi:uncharacterized membrane protein YeaQ/YmgE (transglycosylase-associated protein family)